MNMIMIATLVIIANILLCYFLSSVLFLCKIDITIIIIVITIFLGSSFENDVWQSRLRHNILEFKAGDYSQRIPDSDLHPKKP